MDLSALLYSLLTIVATTTAKDVHQAPVVPDENGALGSAIEGGATPTHLAKREANHRRMIGNDGYYHHAKSCVAMPMDKPLYSGKDREVVARWNNIYKEPYLGFAAYYSLYWSLIASMRRFMATPSLFTPIPGITTLPRYTTPSGYYYPSLIQHPVRVGLTPEECAEFCNKRPSCKGFEYGVNYVGQAASI